MKICQIYGVILAWADREGRLDWNGAPSTFMSIELLVDFITERRRSVSDATTFGNVRDLAMIMKFLSGEDTRWIRGCVAGPTRAEARAARVLKPLFDAGPFLDKIVVALDEAMNWPLTETTHLRVRDLLLAGFGISSPIRFRNLWELRVGHDLIRRKTAWEILLEEYEVKNRLTVQHTIPSILTPFADRYVAVDRPRLLRANRADRMWISSEARWMSQASVRHSFNKVGMEFLGHPLNPHRVRHVSTTETLERDPRALETAALIIGDGDVGAVYEYYDESGMRHAQAELQKLWDSVRDSGQDRNEQAIRRVQRRRE